MITTEIWCTEGYDTNPPTRALCAMKCKMPSIPPKDTLLTLHDGWGASLIKSVFFDVQKRTMLIQIEPDYTGEYREKSVKLGFVKDK